MIFGKYFGLIEGLIFPITIYLRLQFSHQIKDGSQERKREVVKLQKEIKNQINSSRYCIIGKMILTLHSQNAMVS